MSQNQLFEILSILIGFSGIMLIFSLLVTALTQAIVHIFALRWRNLKDGIEELLSKAQELRIVPNLVQQARDHAAKSAAKNEDEKILEFLKAASKEMDIPPEQIAAAEEKYAKSYAAYERSEQAVENLRNSVSALENTSEKTNLEYDPKKVNENIIESLDLKNEKKQDSRISWLLKFLAPKTSWIMKDELEIMLYGQKELSSEVIEKILFGFSRMEKKLKQRFSLIVRSITICCALLVAFVFQLSALDVLRELSTNQEYRDAIVMNLISDYEGSYNDLFEYEQISSRALEQLQDNHPELSEMLERVNGEGSTQGDLLDELGSMFAENPEQQALVLEYESILDELHHEGYEQAVKVAEESISKFALFDIRPFGAEMDFYLNFRNFLGMLITTIFISLGAPFWFNMLRKLMDLRDSLAPEEKNTKKQTQ